ncbi:Abi-alpha family protein [Dawidia soli]|uniref:DUF4393 domain-containing protein n=1 Tax=Dawidia soli TaxID=2782352 RepID=A0AAP2D8W3_9BACT|nr:Abi-alpha family protein [Dawidia soli]MBT1687389.1 DUF4393 domain-containing protein [Dawidia soli]
MSEIKFDLTSSIGEKSLDLAKSFLGKLISPSVEEVGLLWQDKVRMWRFKNQIQMLNKANAYCEKNSINPKKISLKVVTPLLEYAGLEEEELLQDKWAILLTNMVDSAQNIENHVFPYILSQISTNEFLVLESTMDSIDKRKAIYAEELEEFNRTEFLRKEDILKRITDGEGKEKADIQNEIYESSVHQNRWRLNKELKALKDKKVNILLAMQVPEPLNGDMKEYELANLVRLGLIRYIEKTYGYVKPHEIRIAPYSEYIRLEDAEVEITTGYEQHILTELGELFIKACTERKNSKKKEE